jgi:hypothetical protein
MIMMFIIMIGIVSTSVIFGIVYLRGAGLAQKVVLVHSVGGLW